MKKGLLSFLVFLAMLISARAQESVPAYRTSGYKGNVSFTSIGFLWNGIETSHGLMLNDIFYLGGGGGMLVGAVGKAAFAGSVFIDTKAYWIPRENTPTTGIRVGYLRNFSGETNNFEANFTVGWSWGLASGNGLSLNVGLSAVLPSGISYVAIDLPHVSLTPVVSLAFEF
jgi:hypothetical protein